MPSEIPFISPLFPPAEDLLEDLRTIEQSNWFTNFGPLERRFSAALAAGVGPEVHAATVANATLGLVAALTCLLGPPRGERTAVLVPSFTFAAGPEAILWSGHRPLFVDIEPVGLQPSLAAAAEVMRSAGDTVAGILLCNTFGIGGPDLDAWERLGREHGVPVVVDSAAGYGSRYPDGSAVGGRGDCEVFSFHATKPLAIGEGGAVLSRDAALVEQIERFVNFGLVRGAAHGPGLNGKMQELNAAIGLRQLARLGTAVTVRRSVLARYRTGLPPQHFTMPAGVEDSSGCFASVLLPDRGSRDAALRALADNGVEVRSYYSPVHAHPYFADHQHHGDLSVTRDVADRIVSLPSHERMRDDDVARVVDVLTSVVGRHT